MNPHTTVDLFSGAAGGWSLGLHRAGYQVVAAAEKDDWRRDMFGRRWGVPVCADVREFGIEWYRKHVGSERPFLVCGSPPCKEYSSANSRGSGLDGDDLFLEAVRITDELRPRWAAFETASPALIRHFCENLKRSLVVGPKLRMPMTREAVIGRLLAAVKPHPDLGLPRLWSAAENDHAIRLMPWPILKAGDVVEDEAATVEEAGSMGAQAARDGKPIIENPFQFGDARRARFDEGWRREAESDGMGGTVVALNPGGRGEGGRK